MRRLAASPWGNQRQGSRNATRADQSSDRWGIPIPPCKRCTRSACRRRTNKRPSHRSTRCSRSAGALGKPRAAVAQRSFRSLPSRPPTYRWCTERASGIADAGRRHSCIGRSRSRCRAQHTESHQWAARRDRVHRSNPRWRQFRHCPRPRSSRSLLQRLQPSPHSLPTCRRRRTAHHKRRGGRAS